MKNKSNPLLDRDIQVNENDWKLTTNILAKISYSKLLGTLGKN